MAIAAVPAEAAMATEAAGSGVAAGEGGLGAARGSARPRRPAQPIAAPGQGQDRKQSQRRSRKRRGRSFLDAPKGRNYQPVILAEFLVAILVVAVVPVAKGGSADAKAKGSPSPYSVGDVKQMVAVGAVYFVLALLSGGKKTGRFAAWFGALVLAALGLAQTRGGGLNALFSIFGPGSGQTPQDILGQGVVSPGTAQQIQNAAENALNPAFYNSVPDATGNFPVINPSTTQSGPLPGITQGPPPGVAAPGGATAVTITPPPGGTGVITTGPGGGVT